MKTVDFVSGKDLKLFATVRLTEDQIFRLSSLLEDDRGGNTDGIRDLFLQDDRFALHSADTRVIQCDGNRIVLFGSHAFLARPKHLLAVVEGNQFRAYRAKWGRQLFWGSVSNKVFVKRDCSEWW